MRLLADLAMSVILRRAHNGGAANDDKQTGPVNKLGTKTSVLSSTDEENEHG